MFTGIIETLGTVSSITLDNTNVHFVIKSNITKELKVDQSVSHNGVCLTVVDILPDDNYKVTAINETLQKTNLDELMVGSKINLERCMTFNGRMDGHIVQGHVDGKGVCKNIKDENGSWLFTFQYPEEFYHLLVNKGSVCINGVSLTVIDPIDNEFSVAIIPYTFEHTNFHQLREKDSVNLEFDIVGKYLARHLQKSKE